MLFFIICCQETMNTQEGKKGKEKKVSTKNKSRCHHKAMAYVRAAEMNF